MKQRKSIPKKKEKRDWRRCSRRAHENAPYLEGEKTKGLKKESKKEKKNKKPDARNRRGRPKPGYVGGQGNGPANPITNSKEVHQQKHARGGDPDCQKTRKMSNPQSKNRMKKEKGRREGNSRRGRGTRCRKHERESREDAKNLLRTGEVLRGQKKNKKGKEEASVSIGKGKRRNLIVGGDCPCPM